MLIGLLMATPTLAQVPLSAAESDPVRLKLMQGFPPPTTAQVRWDDASMWTFPKTRWAFSHMRELVPTVGLRRDGAVSPLPRAERADLDAVQLTTLDGRHMTWRESLDANHTDGILVLHRGRVVYERYIGALGPKDQHIAMSVTKSFIGSLAELLIAEGKLDPSRTVASYVPELSGSGFGDASVRQVMDMRTGLGYSEDYAGMGAALSDVTRMMIAAGGSAPPPGYKGPDSNYAFAVSIAKEGTHGGGFNYKTPNSIVLGWVLERITGQPIAAQLEARFWVPMGMEQDAALLVDRQGVAFAGGGLLVSLRDMARFGEMIRLGGRWNGQRIMPETAVRAILKGGDPAAFVDAKYPGLDGGNYGSQWWHRAGGQTMAVGINGQGIYIDPKAELVIVRFASHPAASNRVINPVTIPAYDAIAARLAGRR
jgi:CubicO group peptidase (beta-lactamase class C family)